MKLNNSCAENINIAYIGGGSKGWAWGLMSDLAIEKEISGTVKLYDIDKNAARNNAIIGNRLFSRKEYEGRWRFEAVDSLQAALTGSNIVIISILPGTFDEMESDVELPKKYGILQPVGDSVGPGGLVRALRTIPMYKVIAEAIRDFSPKAWVINYTNPMTICTQTLYAVFPKIKVIGCCHEVFGTQKLLAQAAMEAGLSENISRSDIKVNVAGINHFTWITSASYRGIDLFPVYSSFVDKYYEAGYHAYGDKNWMNDHFAAGQRVKFDLFKRYGIIAAAGDRHLAEFVPASWYLKDEETLKKFMFNLTTVEWRKGNAQDRNEEAERLVAGEQEFKVDTTGEEGVKIIKALVGLGTFLTNANMPNIGQMGNIPTGSVVETNILVQRDEITPLYSGALTDEVNNLVLRHVYNQRSIIEAGLNIDKNKAFCAFINDPLVNISLKNAEELFGKMLKNTEKYLPGWKI